MIKVRTDLEGVQKKLDKIADNDKVGMFLSSTCARYMDQYVPYRTGNLKDHARTVVPFQAIYETDYAKKVYYGKGGITIHTDQHPNATTYWDKAMIASHENQIAKEVTNFIDRL